MNSKPVINVNGRTYRWPEKPVVVVCIDGSEPDYIEQAIAAGAMPWMQQLMEDRGVDLRAHCVVPSFSNPNNISIVTGVPPVVHGICGNFFYDVLLGIRSHSRTRSKLRWVAHFVPGFQNRRRVIGLLHRTSVGPR